jgi:hypothetical protein
MNWGEAERDDVVNLRTIRKFNIFEYNEYMLAEGVCLS